MKSAFLFAGFSAISAESIDLDTAIENLRVLNEWVETSLYEQEMVGTKIGDRMEKWQGDLQEAFRAGASRTSKYALEDLEETGCYGHPLQKGETGYAGKGQPADLIDELSKSLLLCYKCAAKDHGSTCNGRGNYNSSFNKKKGSVCQDRRDTCGHTICQCDLQFAQAFGKMSISFDESFSTKNGFDREARCIPKAPKDSSLEGRSGSSGNKAQKSAAAVTECCGFGLGRTIFKVDKQVCCNGDTVKPIGSC